jgi:hypothetical protein
VPHREGAANGTHFATLISDYVHIGNQDIQRMVYRFVDLPNPLRQQFDGAHRGVGGRHHRH